MSDTLLVFVDKNAHRMQANLTESIFGQLGYMELVDVQSTILTLITQNTRKGFICQ